MRRVGLTFILLAFVLVGLWGISLLATGTPAFGLLAGSTWQARLSPPWLDRGSAPAATSSGQRGPLAVATARVVDGTVPVTLSLSGQLRARRTVELRARVTGYLDERTFEEASFVEAGEVLYRLRTREFEAAVAELEARVEGARADLAFLERETERISALEEENFAARSRLDELQSERAQARARREQAKAALRQARLDLDFAVIEAPFAGKVGFSNVDPGDLVTANQTLLTELVEYDPIEVVFRPNAEGLNALRERLQEVEAVAVLVELDGDPNLYEGRITGLGAAFDDDTNTIAVRAELANPEQALIPGQFARVTVELGDRPALLVPATALVTNQNKRALFRIDSAGEVEVVPVTTGRENDGRIAVDGALEPGDRIVTGRLQSVRPGMAVRPLEDEAEARGR